VLLLVLIVTIDVQPAPPLELSKSEKLKAKIAELEENKRINKEAGSSTAFNGASPTTTRVSRQDQLRSRIAELEKNKRNKPAREPVDNLTELPDISGVWSGFGSQDNGSRWSITIIIGADGSYTIAYPSLSCGGELMLVKNDKTILKFHEKIGYGKSKCVDNGQVVLQHHSMDTLDYTWYYQDGRLGARGIVVRQDKNLTADIKEAQPAYNPLGGQSQIKQQMSTLMRAADASGYERTIAFSKPSNAPALLSTSLIVAQNSSAISAIDSIQHLKTDEILMRVKLGNDDYLLYTGEINADIFKNGEFHHLEFPEASRWKEFITLRIYSSRESAPEDDVPIVYFDHTGVYVDKMNTLYFVNNNNWNSLSDK